MDNFLQKYPWIPNLHWLHACSISAKHHGNHCVCCLKLPLLKYLTQKVSNAMVRKRKDENLVFLVWFIFYYIKSEKNFKMSKYIGFRKWAGRLRAEVTSLYIHVLVTF